MEKVRGRNSFSRLWFGFLTCHPADPGNLRLPGWRVGIERDVELRRSLVIGSQGRVELGLLQLAERAERMQGLGAVGERSQDCSRRSHQEGSKG